MDNLLITKEDAKKHFNFDVDKKIFQDNLDWLKPYNAMSFFELDDYVLLLNIETKQTGLGSNIPLIKALIHSINSGLLPNSKVNHVDFCNGDFDVLIERTEGEQWAIHNGYKWHLPPYKPFNVTANNQTPASQPQENNSKPQAQIEELQTELEELQTELEELKNQNIDDCCDIPDKTNKDKLAGFISMLLRQDEELLDEKGNLLTYSKIHTKLINRKFTTADGMISKNLLGKYLDEIG